MSQSPMGKEERLRRVAHPAKNASRLVANTDRRGGTAVQDIPELSPFEMVASLMT